MRLYLDICCLKRPFDDQAQPRVRIETEAVLGILDEGLCWRSLTGWGLASGCAWPN